MIQVIAASLLHQFSQCIGYEVLEGLNDIALKAKDKYIQLVDKVGEITFYYKTIANADISNADIVYCTTGTFDLKVFLYNFQIESILCGLFSIII